MITDTDKNIIEQLARKYHAKRVVLFGSSLSPTQEYRDIDIAVEGIEEKISTPSMANYCALYQNPLTSLTCLRRLVSSN